jgi:hypothetical protein
MDEFKTEETGRRLANVVLASGELGRPYLAPPGIPAERLKTLREAFMKLMTDPAFLADINGGVSSGTPNRRRLESWQRK